MFAVRLLRKLFIDQWRVIDDEAALGAGADDGAAKPSSQSKGQSKGKKKKKHKPGKNRSAARAKPTTPRPYDWRPIVFLVLVCIVLTFQWYWGHPSFFKKLWPTLAKGTDASQYKLWGFAWSTAWRVIGCVIIPLIAIAVIPGERFRDYGAALRRYFKRRWYAIALLLLVVPELLFGTVRGSLLEAYPNYSWGEAGPTYLLSWVGLHVVQLLCLEFFFRVFTLTGLRRRLGSSAIFVMVVPYCMLLFPGSILEYGGGILESLWVLASGVVLGTLAMRTTALKTAGRGLVRAFAFGQWAQIEAEVAAERGAGAQEGGSAKEASIEPTTKKPFDWRPVIFLVVVAISLTLQQFWGDRGSRGFMGIWSRADLGLPERDYQLLSFCWWSGWRFIGYVLVPILAIALMPGQRVRDCFVSFRGFFKHLWIYVGLFMLVLPAVLFAATQKSFLATYPFYKWSNMGFKYFIAWQLLYALQFVSLEFFFRGFMLAGLREKCGSASIFIMCVPYCMIHYGKPMPETLGAIIAGLVLGTLAMRTRSIWGGALIHIAVAVTMDLLSIRHCPDASTGRPCPNIPH